MTSFANTRNFFPCCPPPSSPHRPRSWPIAALTMMRPVLQTKRMDDTPITVRRYTDFAEMKADEYRYW